MSTQPSAAASSSAAPIASASASSSESEVLPIAPPTTPVKLSVGGRSAVRGAAGLVTSVEANATRAGVDVLEKGGNAVDAAVAVGYALAVTHPSAGNIGGGGFMLIRMSHGDTVAIDFRETAPKAATTKKVLDEITDGAFGYHSVAVPGTVAGLDLARDKFGTMPLADLLAPAIRLAKKGHPLAPRAAKALAWQWDKLKGDPTARSIFGKGKKALAEGERLVQPELARTLEAIAKKGDAGFYAGDVAERIDAAMKKNGGDITKEDLAGYAPKVRAPLRFSYRGLTIDTMPPPSMGGVAIAEMMLSLERLHTNEKPVDSAESVHDFVESAKRAYADRRMLGADPDFYGDKVAPDALARLLSPKHIAERRPPIEADRATPSSAIGGSPEPGPHESPETTHFSVVDRDGNAVSCTVTLSASFGAKIVIPKTGILMSNALGGFSSSGINEVAPGKRMASSMSPTLVSRGDKVVLVVGSPGGDTIPNTVTQLLRNLIDYGMSVDEAVKHGRVHHQLLPDVIRTEKANPLPSAVEKRLVEMGYKLEPSATPLGDGKVIMIDEATGEAWGYSDEREGGLALGAKKSPKK
jgi:gamma-glutamyltranspeptidase/glutathione hydrolase